MEDDPVHRTLRKIADKLEELGIPYAIAGGMALGAHHFIRATALTWTSSSAPRVCKIHDSLDGRGFVPPFAGSRNLRDVDRKSVV